MTIQRGPLPQQRGQFTEDAGYGEVRVQGAQAVAGSDPRSPKGFWRDTRAKSGGRSRPQNVFLPRSFGFLTCALRCFSRPWPKRL
jgi:hypothetical protein